MDLIEKSKVFKTTQNKKNETCIQQTQARQLKDDLLVKVKELFATTYGFDIVRNENGLILLIPNDDLGAIPVALDMKIKSLDYDYVGDCELYDKKQQQKAEKKAKKEKKAATQ